MWFAPNPSNNWVKLGGRPKFAPKTSDFRCRPNGAQKVPPEGVGGGKPPPPKVLTRRPKGSADYGIPKSIYWVSRSRWDVLGMMWGCSRDAFEMVLG